MIQRFRLFQLRVRRDGRRNLRIQDDDRAASLHLYLQFLLCLALFLSSLPLPILSRCSYFAHRFSALHRFHHYSRLFFRLPKFFVFSAHDLHFRRVWWRLNSRGFFKSVGLANVFTNMYILIFSLSNSRILEPSPISNDVEDSHFFVDLENHIPARLSMCAHVKRRDRVLQRSLLHPFRLICDGCTEFAMQI